MWRKLTGWLAVTPLERQRLDRTWNLIDRIFKVAGWLLVIAAFGALAKKMPHGSHEQRAFTAIVVVLFGALCLAVLSPYMAWLASHLPDPKGFSILKRLSFFPVFILLFLIAWEVMQLVEFALLTVLSVKELP